MGKIIKEQRKGVPLDIESQLGSDGRLKEFVKFGINRFANFKFINIKQYKDGVTAGMNPTTVNVLTL